MSEEIEKDYLDCGLFPRDEEGVEIILTGEQLPQMTSQVNRWITQLRRRFPGAPEHAEFVVTWWKHADGEYSYADVTVSYVQGTHSENYADFVVDNLPVKWGDDTIMPWVKPEDAD